MNHDQPQRKWLDDPRTVRIGAQEPFTLLHRTLPGRTCCQSLNGTWHARIVEKSGLDSKFIAESPYHPGFSEIQVPSWLEEDILRNPESPHIHPVFPWDGQEEVEEGHTPARLLQAQYLLDFDLDPELERDEVFLVFKGVRSAWYCWLNGHFLGYSTDSWTPASFDVSELLKEKHNRLAVLVFPFSSGSWLEQQSTPFWGIWNSVELHARRAIHIEDLKITTDLLEEQETGLIRVQIQDSHAQRFLVRLYDPYGVSLFEQSSRLRDLRFEIRHPILWSAEHPALYTLEINVLDERGVCVETIVQKVGIRKVWIEEGILLLNGTRLMLHGVNYVPASFENGSPVSTQELLEDVLFMKKNNINAVRTPGHPLDEVFYELCDQFGLYVMDEAAVNSRGSVTDSEGNLLKDPLPDSRLEWRRALIERAASMYAAHKNHSSILFWSIGRQSGYGDDLLEEAAWLRLKDPHRIIHYETNPDDPQAGEYRDCSDLCSRVQPSPAELSRLLDQGIRRPVICASYMHMEGNALGGLYRYAQLEQYPHYQGGFLERFIRPPKEPEAGSSLPASGSAAQAMLQEIHCIFSPVRILPDPSGVQILNSALFSDTSNLRFFYEQKFEQNVIVQGELEVVLDPGTYAHFPIPWKNTRTESVCTVWAVMEQDEPGRPAGSTVGFGQHIQGKTEYFYSTPETLSITRGRENIGFRFGEVEMLFGKEGLLSLKCAGKEWLRSIPRPVFSHAFTTHEKENGFDLETAFWQGASLFCKVSEMRQTYDPKGHYATLSYQYRLPYPYPSSSSCTVTYTLAAPGILGIDLSLDAARSLPDLSVFGMQFELPKECSRFLYYGFGPLENYRDRQEGARLDLFEADAQSSLTDYALPQECGNRTGVRWLELFDPQGICLRFSKIGRPFEASVLPFSFQTLESTSGWAALGPSDSVFVRIAADHKAAGGVDWPKDHPLKEGLPARNSRRLSFFLSFPNSRYPQKEEGALFSGR